MKISKLPPGSIAKMLVYSALASLCAIAQAEPSCSTGTCPRPTVPTESPLTAVSPSAEKQQQVWTAPREASLRELLSQWAAASGWQEPVWKLKPEEDFTLGASFEHIGELTSAVPALFDAFPQEFGLRVRMYAANRLIVVEQSHE